MPWDLADTRAPGSWLPAPGQRWPHPFLCPYMGVRERLPGIAPPPASARTQACCHSDQARSRMRPPLSGQWNRPRTPWLGNCLPAPRAEPLLGGGNSDWRTLRLGVFGVPWPPLWSRSQVPLPRRRTPLVPGRGARSSRIRVTEAGPGSFPQGCCHISCRRALPGPVSKEGVGLGDRARAVGLGLGTRSREGVGQTQGHWGKILGWGQSIQRPQPSGHPKERTPIMEDPAVQVPRILRLLLPSCLNQGPSVIDILALKVCPDPNST